MRPASNFSIHLMLLGWCRLNQRQLGTSGCWWRRLTPSKVERRLLGQVPQHKRTHDGLDGRGAKLLHVLEAQLA